LRYASVGPTRLPQSKYRAGPPREHPGASHATSSWSAASDAFFAEALNASDTLSLARARSRSIVFAFSQATVNIKKRNPTQSE